VLDLEEALVAELLDLSSAQHACESDRISLNKA
jgi:hypothetical protein